MHIHCLALFSGTFTITTNTLNLVFQCHLCTVSARLILCDNIHKSTVDSYNECALSTVQFVK